MPRTKKVIEGKKGINLQEQIEKYADLTYKVQFQKDKEKENMDIELKEIISNFKKQIIEKFKNESDLKIFLDNIHKFNNYSFNNQMLIFLQNQNATHVMSETNYNKLGYKINNDEAGIKIFIPCFFNTFKITNADGTSTIKYFKQLTDDEKKKLKDKKDASVTLNKQKLTHFKVGNVYDISQTNMPIDEINKELNPILKDENSKEYIDDFIKVIYKDGFKVKYETISNGAKGYCDHKEKTITLKDGLGSMMKLKVLIHEYAHAIAHKHLEDNNEEYKEHRNKYEVEAETIAYVVSRYFGLDTADYSLNYIYGWSKDKDIKEVDDSLQIIVNNSKRIINNFEKMHKKSLELKAHDNLSEIDEPTIKI